MIKKSQIMMRLFLLSIVIALANPLTAMAQENMSPDARTLKALVDAGSNLAKPHVIDHWLYFRDETTARAAGQELTAVGFSVEGIIKESEGADWRLLARKTMVPRLADVERTSTDLEDLAKRHHGDYDGWETQIEE